MDRRAWKEAARQDAALARNNSILVTQIYLILTLSLMALHLCTALLLRHFGASGSYLIQWSFNLLRGFLQILLTAGYTAFVLGLIRREAPGLDTLWAGLRRPGRVIWLNILQGIFITLWIMLFFLLLGLIYTPISAFFLYSTISDAGTALNSETMRQALLSPASLAATAAYIIALIALIALVALVAFITYRYYAAIFLLMDYPQLTARQALKLSVTITKGHRWKLFVLDLSFLPWRLLCYLTLGILLIWKLPYIQATRARAYRAIMDDYGQRRENLRAYWDQMWLKEPTQGPEQDVK